MGEAGVGSNSQGSFPNLLSAALEPSSVWFLQHCGAQPHCKRTLSHITAGRSRYITTSQINKYWNVLLSKDRGPHCDMSHSPGSQSGLLPSQAVVMRKAHESMQLRPQLVQEHPKHLEKIHPATICMCVCLGSVLCQYLF